MIWVVLKPEKTSQMQKYGQEVNESFYVQGIISDQKFTTLIIMFFYVIKPQFPDGNQYDTLNGFTDRNDSQPFPHVPEGHFSTQLQFLRK